ncbi:glycosyltransferase [Massilia sp. P8910]|uniref:glycosyltransferase family protein n=1 Tax=Massilia antarctica TaxID=2765360 RepID=UPI001E3CA957|nr:glycosyltransferase [Massilia antarctica]MCE3602894.1 glycosyltransferase [Massilia antarctica]
MDLHNNAPAGHADAADDAPDEARDETQDETQDKAAERLIRGRIERIDASGVSGWCLDLNCPQEQLALEFRAGGKPVGFTTCGVWRDDLGAEGIDPGRVGFHWPLPRHLPQLALDTLEAWVFETPVRLEHAPAHGAHLARAARHAGAIVIERVESCGIAGVLHGADPARAVTVELHADGVLAATHTASAPTHAFVLALPDALFDGQPHRLLVRAPELDAELALTPAQSVFQAYQGGSWHTRNGILYGWIDPQRLPGGAAELRVDDGARSLGKMPVDAAALVNGAFSFKFEMPFSVYDGARHEIAINLQGTRYRLCAQGGALSLAWCNSVIGRVDLRDTNGICGWALDTADSGAVLTVGLYQGEQLLAQTTTQMARSDVNKLFKSEGRHGFELLFPAALYDRQARQITVRVNGMPLNLRLEHDVPLLLSEEQLALIAPAERYQGYVEQLTTGAIMGWAWDRKNPALPVHVAIHVDDELLDVVQANRFNARLRSDNRHGHHVFLLKFPARLMNGSKRRIRAVIVEGNLEIKQNDDTLLFPLVDHGGRQIRPLPDGHYAHSVPPRLWQGGRARPPAVATESATPLISIIVLNWNGATILRDYLDSMLRIDWLHSYELLLVDHGSTDASLEVAAEYAARLPLRVLARGVNFSFSASNNYAAAQARGPYLVFANNDLVMLHDCFAPMRAHLDDERVGAVGLKLLEPLVNGADSWRFITHHQGVQFKTDQLPGKGGRYYAPMEVGEQPHADLAGCYDLPVATGALLMCRSEDFRAVGGFHEGYVYGMEDVDLCLALRLKLGKTILCDTAAVALHNRSATRDAKILAGSQQKVYSAKVHANNRRLYIERYGRDLTRTILRALVEGDSLWRPAPLRVTIAVTATDISTAAGDFFTALEFGEALQRLYGWEVMFVNNQVHQLPGTDVLVAMRHDYAIDQISEANPGLVTVAWVRNRVDQWLAAPQFQAYQLIFASSHKAIEHIKAATGIDATLLPIATNAARFRPMAAAIEHASDVTFTGSYWGAEREAIGLQDLAREPYRFAIYGHGWQERPDWKANWRGAVPYAALPQIYNSAKIVLDDSHPVTRDWNSLNSRVFDAIASGKLVLTNCSGGAAELFPDLLPSFDTDQQLQALLRHFLRHDDERETLAARLHREVLDKHTYDQRAATFRQRLRGLLDQSLRFAIKIGVPSVKEREQWGDYHFALGIKRALERRGHVARIDILPDWYGGLCASDDVVIVLRGLSQYQPQPTTINLAWLISHPDEVTVTELQQYHHVFVASDSFAAWLGERMGDQVSPLLQCTDPALFYPERDAELEVPEVIFVGNSRGQLREVVQYALAGGVDFKVYGGLWEGILPPHQVPQTYIANARLRHYYSGARVVLNDHWSDMRSQGFLSNRLFDAGACGATIVTDEMQACRALFGDALHYYSTPQNLAAEVAGLRGAGTRPDQAGERLRELIVNHHTFQHRVDAILQVLARLSPQMAAGALAGAVAAVHPSTGVEA